MIALTSAKPNAPLTAEYKEGKYYEPGTNQAFSGYYIIRSESNTMVTAEGTLNKGLMHGVWRFYHGNGKAKSIVLFEAGQQLRIIESWYYGGERQNIFDESNEVDTSYYRSGKVKSITHYRGYYKNGDAIEWYENGNIKKEYTYYDHMEHGVCKEYYENGQLALLSIYNDGKENGLWLAYRPDGSLQFKGRYSGGFKTGKWYERGADGKLQRNTY